MSSANKTIITSVVVVVLILLVGWLVWSRTDTTTTNTAVNATVYSTDTTLAGNQQLIAGEKVIVKNGATLTVNGNYTIAGHIACEDGPLNLVITGDLTVTGEVLCNRGETVPNGDMGDGLNLVVTGNIDFSDTSVVVSNGHIQLVSDMADLATSQEDIDKIFEDAGNDEGEGQRVGPFIPIALAPEQLTYSTPVDAPIRTTSPIVITDSNGAIGLVERLGRALIPTANAQATDAEGNIVPNTRKIGGNWHMGNPNQPPPFHLQVPTPPPGINKIILNFNFGNNGDITLHNWILTGPDGHPGEADTGSCDVTGKPGKDAMRLLAVARNITVNNVIFNLGNGGKGGYAENSDDCDPGTALGGPGGQAGNLKMIASGNFNITAGFTITPGKGGEGGEAYAIGKTGEDGCAGDKGGDANATGGAGADNIKGLKTVNVSGVNNVTLNPLRGGDGGEATSEGGLGGNGDACDCDGGPGGQARSTGGDGGNATSRTVESYGGDAGLADIFPGTGGNGFDCDATGPGGDGGRGGDVQTAPVGQPGTGLTSNGGPQTSIFKEGGDGGNGGDGCNEGAGGKEGKGDPDGDEGLPGDNLCITNTNTGTSVTNTSTEEVQIEIVGLDLSFGYDHQNPQCPLSIGNLQINNAPPGSYFNLEPQSGSQFPVWLNFPDGSPYEGGVQGIVNGPFPAEFPCVLDNYQNQTQDSFFDIFVYSADGTLLTQDSGSVNGDFQGF